MIEIMTFPPDSHSSPPAQPIKQRRGIYLLPNLFTTAALFAGFYAIIAATNQRFEAAAIAIFVAMILDGVDGRVARLTNTQSAFGAEYDSLSDLVSFGLAPSLVMYEWVLSDLGKIGWLAAFVYTACAALRLARFNVQVEKIDKAHFQGLPSPAAAAVLAGFVWWATDYQFKPSYLSFIAVSLMVATAALMVSNIRYRSFKDLDIKGKVPFFMILLIVIAFVLISIDPPQILFWLFFLYAISGVVLTLNQLRRRRAAREERHQPPRT